MKIETKVILFFLIFLVITLIMVPRVNSFVLSSQSNESTEEILFNQKQ